MAGIGKLFKFGSKKPPELPRKDYDDSEEEGYMDPSICHSAIPQSSGSLSSKMPNYPPPRPNHPSIAPKPVDNTFRSQYRNQGEGYKPPIKPRPVRTQRNAEGNQSKPVDDYCDPWDAKQRKPKMTADDYCDPVDVTRPAQAKGKIDDYSDPWDSRPGHITKPKVKKTGVKDEYIDPWDAKGPQNLNQEKPDSDDDSYTEPYDSGKVTALDEQAKRLSLRGMRLPSAGNAEHDQNIKYTPQTHFEDNRPTDDYASPWESKGLILPSQTSIIKQTQAKVGQMPLSDERPCEDYDKPWEWTAKQQMHQYINGPVSDPNPTNTQSTTQVPVVDSRPENDYDAPWEYNKRTSQLVSMAQEQAKSDGSSIPPKPSRVGIDDDLTFTIDLSLPLEKQSWYHGPITRVEAECLLKHEENGSFLVRDSESSGKDYSLSFKNNNAFMHLKIAVNAQGKYVLGQFSLPYDAVPEIIDYYSRNKLNIRGAVHSYLKNPIIPRHDYFVLEKR